MNDALNTPAAERVRTHAVDLLSMVARYRYLVAAAATLQYATPAHRRQAAELDREAEELIARCTGVSDGSASTSAPTRYKDTPTLRVGDLVQFDCGDDAGICGELIWLSMMTGRCVVATQNEDVLEGVMADVSKVM